MTTKENFLRRFSLSLKRDANGTRKCVSTKNKLPHVNISKGSVARNDRTHSMIEDNIVDGNCPNHLDINDNLSHYKNTESVICINNEEITCISVSSCSESINDKRSVNSNNTIIYNIDEPSDNEPKRNSQVHDIYTPSPPKKVATAEVNLPKKEKLSLTQKSSSRILISNTDDKYLHVIQSPNCKTVKGKSCDRSKLLKQRSSLQTVKNGKQRLDCENLKQKYIDTYFRKPYNFNSTKSKKSEKVYNGICQIKSIDEDALKMSKNTVGDIARGDGRPCKGNRKENGLPSKITAARRNSASPKQDIKGSSSDATRVSSLRIKNESIGSCSPRKAVESSLFNSPLKSKSNKTTIAPRNIPHFKILAGTQFAVDAFSYGEIPNVKHYFLTHFHSDHYCGLKKSFNKLLYCSKITADLCVSRLGVSMKCIQIINADETVKVEGVEVMAMDANHCPGALMLVFTLPSGRTLLHTGDFRASPVMESHPIFWNKDIHSIYLDTTYCNPRYDFPTQDQSLEMALYILRQKKMALEKAGKKFSTVLIVCGTYTIGKEKFFLGMARRVGCSVWACPEKDRVLQAVEGRSFSHAPPQSCQLHVVPMRDLTHEKLRCYLDSLQGAFQEVVAFKPSGWENGKNSAIEMDSVTIHGIPYSEHSSFSEMIRFVKYLKPKQVIPTVDISGGIKAVQKYFPCPLVNKEDIQCQSRVTDYFSIQSRQQVPAVT